MSLRKINLNLLILRILEEAEHNPTEVVVLVSISAGNLAVVVIVIEARNRGVGEVSNQLAVNYWELPPDLRQNLPKFWYNPTMNVDSRV